MIEPIEIENLTEEDVFKSLIEGANFLRSQPPIKNQPLIFAVGGKIFNANPLTKDEAQQLHDLGLFND